jgi:hypothetical protein
MAESEANYLAQCRQEGICPRCREVVKEKYGTGRFEDGVFCSLDCYAEWHKAALIRRHDEARKEGPSE